MAEKDTFMLHYWAIYLQLRRIQLKYQQLYYKHFANMKCTIYGNRLPKGTQVIKGWEPLS